MLSAPPTSHCEKQFPLTFQNSRYLLIWVLFVSVHGLQEDGAFGLRAALHLYHNVVFGRLLFGAADKKKQSVFVKGFHNMVKDKWTCCCCCCGYCVLSDSEHSHFLLSCTSAGNLSFLVKEVEKAAEDGQQQQRQNDHNNDHPAALGYTHTRKKTERTDLDII